MALIIVMVAGAGGGTAWARSPKELSPLLSTPVTTTGGRLLGVRGAGPGVAVFKGIPYAAPPLGNLRWTPAQPAASWHGDLAGDRYGPACIQPRQAQRVPNNRSVDLPDSPPMSEDCLYLNVWTAATSARAGQPVMVFLGTGYREGAGSTPANQGDTLAAKDVVVVTFNYRLGALGFLAHPELTAESPHKSSGNYALSDALAALQWVQKNIRAFGGDPANVTIFGESDGAAMCAALAGSPQAAGLFQRVIAESGTWMGLTLAPMRTLAAAEQEAVKAAAALEAPSLAALRALPAQDAAARLPVPGVIIDGWIIPEDLSRTFAQHRQNKVDVLAGSNRDEGTFLAAAEPAMTLARWTGSAPQRWGAVAELALKAYPATDDAQAAAQNRRVLSDTLQWTVRVLAESQHALGKHAYVYHFAHEPPGTIAPGTQTLGACPGCELPYVFDHLSAPRSYPDTSSPDLAAAPERELARVMSSYWINFAKTGDPNGRNLPKWPPLNDAAKGPVLQIADPIAPGDSLGEDKVRLYRSLSERQLQGLP